MTNPIADHAPPPVNIVVGKCYETKNGGVFECLFELDNPINEDNTFGGIWTNSTTGHQFVMSYPQGGKNIWYDTWLVKEINMSWPARIARAFRDWFQKEDNSPLTPALIIALGVFAFKMMGGA